MQPQEPNPDFNFILNDNSPPKRGIGLPKLPKPAKVILFTLIGIIMIVIVLSALSSRSASNSQAYINVVARGQETLRVTSTFQQKLQDFQTQATAATVSATITSDQAQITSYLAKNHVKISKVQLNADIDKTTDTSLQNAAQNNNLDAAYQNYLKTALVKYQSDLKLAYASAGPAGKQLLKTSYASAGTLLAAAPLKL